MVLSHNKKCSKYYEEKAFTSGEFMGKDREALEKVHPLANHLSTEGPTDKDSDRTRNVLKNID